MNAENLTDMAGRSPGGRRVPFPLALAVAAVLAPACGSPSSASPDGPAQAGGGRPEVRGAQGAVSAGHPLAAGAGMDVLRRGGNAVDAAVAMAAVLAVVRPHMNGVGGDAFALVYEGATGTVHGLNGSGRAGARATPEHFAERGFDAIPETGALSVSVPGAVAAWHDAHARFGSMPFSDLLAFAIGYAEDGFPVSTRLARDFEAQGSELNEPGRALYLPAGAPPAPGSALRNPALAGTLRSIAAHGKDGFYRGEVAARLAAFADSAGGLLTASDLHEHVSTWVEPLSAAHEGVRLHVLPPNSQGIAQLAFAKMAARHDLARMGHNTPEYLHALIELKKLAFADRDAWVADPEFSDVPTDRLLDSAYLAARSRQFDPSAAATGAESGLPGPDLSAAAAPPGGDRPPRPGASPAPAGFQRSGQTGHARQVARQRTGGGGDMASFDDSGDTVYLTAVDRWGNAVSWIQSLFHGFGSGLLEPETGVLLHNRGALHVLDPAHPNVVAPGKRPYHTLTPLLATDSAGAFAFTLGTPGGDGQTQTLMQIVQNLLLFGMTPQQAIEAPRFRSYSGLRVQVEDRVPAPVRERLAALGHQLEPVAGWTAAFGGAQMIRTIPASGTLVAAADPRREAYALAY